MFANITNYLLGNYADGPKTDLTAAIDDVEERFRAVDTEDDWLMVEKTDVNKEQQENEIRILDTHLGGEIPERGRSPGRGGRLAGRQVSRSSSASSLPCLSLEESWYITPPPCFTSAGPAHLETSPLENLLIEHPSMSVYHRRAAATSPAHSQRLRSRSVSPSHPQPLQPLPDNRRPAHAPAHQRHQPINNQIVQLKAAQKQQQRRACQALKRNQLERSNKAIREISMRNKRQRRSDRTQNHSGVNNNRKCC
nr:PREDICTED: LOW QUALITY PROTEIN: tumor protein p53-inducible nuclear protein 2 [Bemisia tabaci]